MKLWICGAAGLLGRALVDFCQSKAIDFEATVRADVDIKDRDAMLRMGGEKKCSHLINCAAYTDVDRAEKEPKEAEAVNAQGAANAALAAKESGMRLIHLSTDYIFDGETGTPYKEGDAPSPLGVYGKTKLEGELRVQAILPQACIVRTSWLFGRRGKNFISTLLERLEKEEEMMAAKDQINRPTLDKDLAEALFELRDASGVFHYASGHAMSRYEIAKDFYREAKKRALPIRCQSVVAVKADQFPSLSPRPKASVLDTEKVSRVLGRKPRLWETILQEYIDHVTASV